MSRPRILHLRASNFVGGPEHQLLRSAELEADGSLRSASRRLRAAAKAPSLREAAESRGHSGHRVSGEFARGLKALEAILRDRRDRCVSAPTVTRRTFWGSAPDAAAGVPVACFLRGWTGENLKVKLYEAVDRFSLRFADRVVCLSNTQADKLTRNSALGRENSHRFERHRYPGALDPDWHEPRDLAASYCSGFRCRAIPIMIATAGRLEPGKGRGRFSGSGGAASPAIASFAIRGVWRRTRCGPRCNNKAQSLNLTPQITFAGFHADLRTFDSGASIFW
jgi:hypothetical protein